jgi:hypothetical protein
MRRLILPAGLITPHSSKREIEVEAARLAETEAGRVNKQPTGPAIPAGGWSVPFADGFAAPLGTGAGQDKFWLPNRFSEKPIGENQPGSNSNELQVYNASQVKVGAQGLELDMTYSPKCGISYGTEKNYLGGMAQGVNRTTMPAGYDYFQFLLGAGSTFAFEFVCKFPLNTGEMNNAMWALAAPWLQEFDFWEAWGWNTHENPEVIYNGGTTWLSLGEKSAGETFKQGEQQLGRQFDPSSSFHRYTIVVFPNNTFSMHIDGVLQKKSNAGPFNTFPESGVIGPVKEVNAVYMGLILQNAARDFETNFTSGTRTFYVRSTAVYQDTAHFGAHTIGGGLAPGTVLV